MDCLKKYVLSEKVVMTVLAYLKGWGFGDILNEFDGFSLKKIDIEKILCIGYNFFEFYAWKR